MAADGDLMAFGSKPPVEGETAQLKNALQKIRSMTPIPDPAHPNLLLAEILEVADKALGYSRAYHAHNGYLEPGIMV